MIDNCSILELKLFRTAALKGSISAAAKIFCMSQSAASSVIQRLERAFGIPLLDHGKNRFQLTPHGYQFLEKLERLELLFEEISALKRNPEKGPWRFALSHSLAVAILPPILKRFEKIWPGIEIHLRIGHATSISEWVATGEVDLGIIIDQNGPLDCVRTHIFTGAYNIYGRSILDPKTPVLIDRIKQESIELAKCYQKRWKRALPIGMDIPSWEVIAALTESGSGAGFLPNLMEISHRKLQRLDWGLPKISYEVAALTRLPPAVFGLENFVNELRNTLDEQKLDS